MNFKIKTFLLVCMVLCMLFIPSITVSATEVTTDAPTTIESRIGIAKYDNHYHNGSKSHDEYTIQTDSITFPAGECTLQTQNFNNDTWINIEIWNSDNKQMGVFSVNGNTKIENKKLLYYINGGKFTIKYDVFDSNGTGSDDGWIGFWFY